MSPPKKRILLSVAGFLSFFVKLVPWKLKKWLLTAFLVIETRGDSRGALIKLLQIEDKLSWVINERAMQYGENMHPKHRLTQYHHFFIQNIPSGASILDVGCGKGVVAYEIAKHLPACSVTGVDRNSERFAEANKRNDLSNLSFILSDVCKESLRGDFNVIILSNVLEHIEKRVDFLKALISNVSPDLFLIRVPAFERDWKMPLRKELGVNYYSDEEHYIEHKLEELEGEVEEAGLIIESQEIKWGEIWMKCGTHDRA